MTIVFSVFYTLMALPLFILAGGLISESGISKRLGIVTKYCAKLFPKTEARIP